MRSTPLRIGFTLLELLIAMTLSVMIILVAYKTFAMVMGTVNNMNRLRTENAMLRTGYFLATEDADFWHSHANPSYPYLKGYLSDDYNDPTYGLNNSANKRPFRPVTWEKDLDDPLNPNWQQPNDKRTWYRNYFSQNPHNFSRSTGEFAWLGYKEYMPQVAKMSKSGITGDTDELGKGWEFWHVHGDYTLVSNLAMHPDETPSVSAEEKIKGAKPNLQWRVFTELGQNGVLSYMTPGTMNLILRPSTNNTVANIGNQANHYDKGEVPWTLTEPVIVDKKPVAGTVTLPGTADWADNRKRHYAESMLAYPFDPHSWMGKKSGYTNNSFLYPMFPFAADINICVSESKPKGDYKGEQGTGNTIPVALFYGSIPEQADFGGTSFTFSKVSGRVKRPVLRLDDPTDPTQFVKRRNDYMSHTWHIPSNYTDAPVPDFSDKPADMPALGTSIMRYRIGGNDKSLCVVRLQDNDTGRYSELRFYVTGTDFRGARQHWGWKSRHDDPGNEIKDMGDDYQ